MYIVTIVLFGSVFIASYAYVLYRVVKNTHTLAKLQNTTTECGDKIKEVVNNIDYNDKLLFKNQKYLYDIYDKNNNFTESENNKFSAIKSNKNPYYNMMKNYDVLDSIAK